MRIRPISIAGICKAVCVTAVLVFLAGWTVPAQAVVNIYVKNSTSTKHYFCTYDNEQHPTWTDDKRIERLQIRRRKCGKLKCESERTSKAGCYIKRCGTSQSAATIAGAGDLIYFKYNNSHEFKKLAEDDRDICDGL